MAKIDDGTGTGLQARVTSENRLATEAVVISAEENAIARGEGWQITSGPITFGAATQTAMLYFNNTGVLDVVMDRAVLILGTVTGGTGDWTFQTQRNPNAGTIITNAVAAGVSNSNHGSATVYPGDAYKGVVGDTLTGGTGAPLPLQPASNRTVFPLGRRLPTGASIGWVITPPTGTTNAVAIVVAHAYVDFDSGA
jgi:hypothetical protein